MSVPAGTAAGGVPAGTLQESPDGTGGALQDPGAADAEQCPALTDDEILLRLGTLGIDAADGGTKGIFINSKNYVSLGFVDQLEEDDAVPFSGMRLRPYREVSKQQVLDEIRKMGFASDFHPHQKDIEKFPGSQLLLLFDPSKTLGEKICMCISLSAYEREKHRIDSLREAVVALHSQRDDPQTLPDVDSSEKEALEENIVVRDLPKACGMWQSDSMEATHHEVANFSVQNLRPAMQVMISRPRAHFGKACKFSDSGENIHNCRPQKDPNFALHRKELEIGIQAVKETATSACQTTWFRPVNKATQYSPHDFLHREASTGYEKVDELSEFLSAVSVSVEEALQTNETVDIFQEEFANLGEEEAGAVSKSHSNIKEFRNFHDVTFTKGKRIEWIEWVPQSADMIASSCCENLPFTERLETSGKATVSTILIWSFQDSLSPHTILVSPWEVPVFKFYPGDRRFLVGGLGNGQLAVWKLSDADLGYAARERPEGGSAGGTGAAGEEERGPPIPTVPHRQASVIDESHRRPVQAIEFLPASLEIEKRGRGASEKNPKDGPVKYMLTVACDGQVMIWDFSAVAEAINDTEFAWRPLHKIPLQRHDSGTEMGCCHILYCQDRFDEKGNKQLTNFYASTEEGELVFGDWAARMEEDRKPEFCRKLFTVSKSFRPMLSLERSPFFPDILLGVTDWAFYLWKDGVSEHLFQSSYSSTYFTRGVWSPSRPSVIFLGLVSGGIDIWDFSDQSHKASLSDTGASVAISSMAFLKHGDTSVEQKLAVGDAQGHLHVHNIPKNLVRKAGKELSNMRKFLEREEKRVRCFQERRAELAELKEYMEKQAQLAADKDDVDKNKAASDEDKLDTQAEETYRKLVETCREQLRQTGSMQAGAIV